MARKKKKGGLRNIAIVGIVAIIIFGIAFYTVPEVRTAISSTGLITQKLVIPIGDDDSWTMPMVFTYDLTPFIVATVTTSGDFDGVHCVIDMKIIQFNVDGSVEPFIEPASLQVELLKITGGIQSSAKEIKFLKGQPVLSCWDVTSKRHTITLEGGTFTTDFRILEDGKIKILSATTKTIPSISRNLNLQTGGGNRLLPSITVQASSIEAFLSFVPDTVAERTIDIFFNTKGTAIIKIDGTITKTGNLNAGAGGKAKFINEDFNIDGGGTGKGTTVILKSSVPTQFYYLGSNTPVPSGVNANQVLREGQRMTVSFTGTEDNWSSSEGQPTITIKSPTGATITSAQMSFRKSLTGGLSEFQTTLAIPIQIAQTNIDLWKGTWTALMKQSGRSQIGSTTFVLGDYRDPEFIPPPPEICQFPKVIISGDCVDQPPDTEPTPDQCPLPVDLLIASRALTNEELKRTWFQLLDKEKAGTLDVCEVKMKPLIETEMLRRGFSLTPPTNGNGGNGGNGGGGTEIQCTSSTQLLIAFRDASVEDLITTFKILEAKEMAGTLDQCEETSIVLARSELNRRNIDPDEGIITPTGSAISFIRYMNFYTDLEGNVGGGGNCPDVEGKVPKEGFPIIGFQLFGLGGTCDEFRLGQIVLTPTLDFGSKVNDIQIDSSTIGLQLRQELFLAKNNPFPSQPDIKCAGSTSTSIGTCAITNYVITNSGIPPVKLESDEAPVVKQFVGRATSGEWMISKVSLQENRLIDKVKATGTVLNDGDELSVMYLIWGKIRGTDNLVPFVRDFPPMTYVQNFIFDAGSDIICQAPSMTVVFKNDGTVESVGQGGQCLPCEELEQLGVGSCPLEICRLPEVPNPETGQCFVPPIECTIPPNKIDPITGECVPDDDRCLSGQVFDELTQSCKESFCQANTTVPICGENEFHDISTTEFDDCGNALLECVADDGVNGNGNGNGTRDACPNENEFRDAFDVCVPLDPNDGCPSGQRLNSAGLCEEGGITKPEPPTGTNCEEGESFNNETQQCERDFCKLDASFNLLQCFASLFSGAPSGTIGGTTLLGIIIFAVVTIAIIIIAVVIKKRGGGGLNI